MTMAEEITVSIPLSAESLATDERIREANARKVEGNDHFRRCEWQEALSAYESAMVFLPNRRGHQASNGPDTQSTEDGEATPAATHDTGTEPLQESLDSETDKACATLRSVLNANIGACYVKLGEHKQAVEACTRALVDDPNYVKALQRRAASNEAINSWSSLSSAQEDYNVLLKLSLPVAETREIETKLRKLKPRMEAAQKEETTEMLGKLKTLGNSVLGNFGLSTDNFKFEPNGQGGYSLNFSR